MSFFTQNVNSSQPAVDTQNLTSAQKADQRVKDTMSMFLQMFTQQMASQDPLSPMDSNQLTQQLVNMTQVEQTVGMNRNLELLLSKQESFQKLSTLGLVGKKVKAETTEFAYMAGDNEQVGLVYELPKTASTAKVKIYNEQNRLVQELDASSTIGEHVIAWNGKLQDGSQAPAGEYHYKVDALDEKQEAIPTKNFVYSVIDGVNYAGEDPIAMIHNQKLSLDKIQEIYR